MKQGKSRISVRRARAADWPSVSALYDELHLGAYATGHSSKTRAASLLRKLLASRDDHLLVAIVNRRIAGTAHVHVFRHLGHALMPVAIVENVVVEGASRSQGIGERLIEEAGRIARRERCYKLSLTSNLSRVRAHRFYERLGWKRTHAGYSIDA
jgi:GNAT superfamily N-acetyltransferase